jgi:hypothetical protein
LDGIFCYKQPTPLEFSIRVTDLACGDGQSKFGFFGRKASSKFIKGSNFKICQILLQTISMYSSSHKDSEKAKFNLPVTFDSRVIGNKVKGQFWAYMGQNLKHDPILTKMVSHFLSFSK